MLDTQRHVETPEGVELALPLAGPVPRARAWAFDIVIKTVVLWIAGFGLAALGSAGFGLFLLLLFLVTWLYPVVFEVLYGGATPGKRLAGLRVVHDDGTPIGWSAALIRSIVGYADMLPFGYSVGLISTLLHPDAKRLGDVAAGTVVIFTDRTRPRILRLDVPAVRPPVSLDEREQHALIEFAARSPTLSRDRLDELVRIAAPLVPEGAGGLRRLLGQARWISGDR